MRRKIQMKHLNGKKLKIWDNIGNIFEGLCVGANDDIVKILNDKERDERVFFIKNIFSYQIVGEGTTGGYSGLKVYVCKNDEINCKGKVLLSSNECHIKDMKCDICNNPKINFKCDFGCIGALEILPTQVQRILFEGMVVSRENNKNYLKEAVEAIKKGEINENS